MWFASSKNTLLTFVVHAENGAQFLNATFVSLAAFTLTFPVTKINASEYSQRLDLIVSVSNLIVVPGLYLPFAVCLSLTYHVFAANLDSSLLESFKGLWFFAFPFYMIVMIVCMIIQNFVKI